LDEVELMDTPLNGLDVSTCSINHILFSANQLRGITVSSEQAVALISLFGIKIKDE